MALPGQLLLWCLGDGKRHESAFVKAYPPDWFLCAKPGLFRIWYSGLCRRALQVLQSFGHAVGSGDPCPSWKWCIWYGSGLQAQQEIHPAAEKKEVVPGGFPGALRAPEYPRERPRPRLVIRGPKILPLNMVKVPKIRENLHNSCFAKMLFREKIRGAYDWQKN